MGQHVPDICTVIKLYWFSAFALNSLIFYLYQWIWREIQSRSLFAAHHHSLLYHPITFYVPNLLTYLGPIHFSTRTLFHSSCSSSVSVRTFCLLKQLGNQSRKERQTCDGVSSEWEYIMNFLPFFSCSSSSFYSSVAALVGGIIFDGNCCIHIVHYCLRDRRIVGPSSVVLLHMAQQELCWISSGIRKEQDDEWAGGGGRKEGKSKEHSNTLALSWDSPPTHIFDKLCAGCFLCLPSRRAHHSFNDDK